jgi:hypothetical protein
MREGLFSAVSIFSNSVQLLRDTQTTAASFHHSAMICKWPSTFSSRLLIHECDG